MKFNKENESATADSLDDILKQDKVMFTTTLTNGKDVTFNMEVLTGEKLIKARKIIAEHHIPEEKVKEFESEDLINKISQMYREIYKLVLIFPDQGAPSDESIDRVVTLSGGISSMLSRKVMECAGLGGFAQEDQTTDAIEQLPS
ncbi:MAG: hypothetical protein OXG15_00290 [Gammaproteobacteria bacterium]|nr:hypothetical protein [Gammaproteobacteria bacterium]